MQRETIIVDGIKFHRYPNSKRTQHKKYYWAHNSNKKSPFPFHRYLWTKAHGEIPKGFHVHHKDHNTLNNTLENLELISARDHAKYHSGLPDRKKKASENAKKNNKKLQEAAKIWRHSEEGRKWHSEHSKESVNKPRKIICAICGKEAIRYSKNAKYCSQKCGNKYNNDRAYRKKKESIRFNG